MDLKQLKYFMHVAELGSYTRAADFLGVAQPLLSRQIRLLETELRHNLLNRHGRGVSLTDSGRILLDHCRIIQQQIDAIQEDLSASTGKLTGHITLGLPPTVAKLLSVDIIKAVRKQLPDAHISIIEGLTSHLQEHLQQGKIDMALLYNPAYSPHLDKQLFYEERLHLIAPKNHALNVTTKGLSAAQLAELPLIAPSAPNSFRLLIEEEMARHNLIPNIRLEINSVEAMLKLVSDGMGYAILSPCTTELMRHPESVEVIPIASPVFTSQLFLATSAKHTLSRTQRELVRLLKDITPLLEKAYNQAYTA
ncbi:MAG: LysR family transcriptional regulator [Neisseria sp.]|uniref:LysR family transcriptional regulator n=1 Tax=Neisseria sp. TaxID=192066 RepID=UPI0026DAB6C2|nr:LysR family transcriptional regulator [Neisseria sp.]MDO4248557.1 LysR family transcriptional regulator [Neisseria sp.]